MTVNNTSGDAPSSFQMLHEKSASVGTDRLRGQLETLLLLETRKRKLQEG